MPKRFLPLELSLSAEAFIKHKRQGSDGMVAAHLVFDPNTDEETRQRIFQRDNHECQYCGFQSEKFQLIHIKDGDLQNKSDKNLVTSCIFCHQCFHVDKVADMKSGTLIWLPELTQAQVHHLARSIYVGRITQGPMADISRRTLEMIMRRREEAVERIKTDDPRILTTVLKDYIPHPTIKAEMNI